MVLKGTLNNSDNIYLSNVKRLSCIFWGFVFSVEEGCLMLSWNKNPKLPMFIAKVLHSLRNEIFNTVKGGVAL